MKSISGLQLQIDSLPKGNVYSKTIKGHVYFYHQYFYAGKRYSRLLKENEVERFKKLISDRKRLERELRDRLKIKDVVLSNAARDKTGDVMSQDRVVARFERGELIYIDEERAPLVIKRTHSLDSFLNLRAIDMSRTNARLLKKALGLKNIDDSLLPLIPHAASISDTYWFKPKHSKMDYKDIRYENDALFDLALKGDSSFFPSKPKQTPELTTVGSFEKGWKKIDGVWWLYKAGSDRERFSELFCAHLSELFGIKTAFYEIVDKWIRTKNFASSLNFEPMASILGEDDSYEFAYQSLVCFGESVANDYLKLMFFDAWVYNVDRHNENYGIMRDPTSGKINSLAPNFDCNLALISRGELPSNPAKDGLIKLFLKFVNGDPRVKTAFEKMDLPVIEEGMMEKIYLKTPESIRPHNAKSLFSILLNRYEYLKRKTKG